MHLIQKSRQLDFVLEVVGAGAGAVLVLCWWVGG